MEKYLNYLLVSLRWLFYYRLSTGQPFIVGERWWKLSKLNLRQQAFADEYIITGNAYQSALKKTDILNVPSELSGLNFYAFLTVTGLLQELTVYSPKQDTTWTYSRSISGTSQTWSSWSKTVMDDDSGKVTVIGTLEMGKIATLTQSTGFGRTTIFTRVGNLVTIYSELRHTTAPPNGWNREVATLPVGWRPIGNSCLWQHDLSNSTKFSWLEVHSSGQVDLYASGGITTSDYMLSASCVYITKDPFPES